MLFLLQITTAMLIKRNDNAFKMANFEDVDPFQDDQIYNYFLWNKKRGNMSKEHDPK